MKTLTHIKLDTTLKQQAQRLAENLGFSLSATVNALLKQFVREEGLTVTQAPRMSIWLENLLAEIAEDIRLGKNTAKPIASHEELTNFFRKL
ncbi:MAG: hypothetical protein WCW27_00765 [Patescibacteria group bacterium]|jgi:addiction module RelB/DinJ family antitoxin